jgi:uncharacterized protein (DUF2249 family)
MKSWKITIWETGRIENGTREFIKDFVSMSAATEFADNETADNETWETVLNINYLEELENGNKITLSWDYGPEELEQYFEEDHGLIVYAVEQGNKIFEVVPVEEN